MQKIGGSMNKLVEKIIKINFDQIETYEFPLDEAFGLEVNYDGTKYCLILNLSSNNKNLICCGPGAHARNSKTSDGVLKKPPFFARWSWFKFFDESFIVYADPIFFYDEDITLGWFVGTKDQWYAETVSKIIKKISINQNINLKNILFYGSSGGGFISICLGCLLKGSKVLVNNTQFTILNYYQTHIDNLFKVLKKEFPNLTQDEIIELINYRLDTVELFKKEQYVPPITYYVNTESKPDMDRHCIPFINDIKNLEVYDNELIIHFYKEKSEKPHSPLPVKKSIAIMKKFAKEYLYND